MRLLRGRLDRSRAPLPGAGRGSDIQAAETVPLLYGLLRGVARSVFRRFFGFRVQGSENLPPAGPYLIASNHCNYLDGVVLGSALKRKITFMVMPKVYYWTPLHPYFHRHVGSIPIELERPDPGAIKRALAVLEAGGVVGIFPEGPFSKEGRLVNGQPGVALIAIRSGVPVVPVAILGTYEALRNRPLHIPRPAPLRVRFGSPLTFERYRNERPVTRQVRDEVTRRIMTEIARLLEELEGTA